MSNNWIKVKRELPPGIAILEDRLCPLVKKIQNLSEEDLCELEAFLNFLETGSPGLSAQSTGKAKKIFDFMDGGMRRAG